MTHSSRRLFPVGQDLIVQIATILLALHGLGLLWFQSAPPTQWAAVITVGLMGVAGLINVTRIPDWARGLITLVAALWLMVETGGTASLFLLWLFVIVVIYPQILPSTWAAMTVPVVVALAYALLPQSDLETVPVGIIWSRVLLLAAIGLTVGTLAISGRRALGFEKGFQVLVESASDAIVAINDRNQITLVNEQAEVVFGYSRSELIGQDLAILIPDRISAQHEDHVAAFLRGPATRRVMSARQELTGVRKNGEQFPVEVTIAKFDNDAGFAATAIIRDVSETRAIMDELRSRERALSDLVDSKDTLIASISHEMRTPLTAVAGFASILKDDSSQISDHEREEMIRTIDEQSSDLANIVDDLLVAARAKAGSLAVVRVPVDLSRLVAQLLDIWKPTEAHRIEFVLDTADTVRAIGDPARIRQILRNLISNAIRYGGQSVRVEIGSANGTTKTSVTDDGPGIPLEDQQRIFDAYERAHVMSGLTASLGLGLTISRHLASLMNGDLDYSYEDGKSTFTLTLPSVDGSI